MATGVLKVLIGGVWTDLPLPASSAPVCEWSDQAFSAANFTASGAMTWTVAAGNVTTLAYARVGKALFMVVVLVNTNVGGTRDQYLQIRIPGGFVPAKTSEGLIGYGQDNNAAAVLRIRTLAGDPTMYVMRQDAALWAISPGNTAISFNATIPIQ